MNNYTVWYVRLIATSRYLKEPTTDILLRAFSLLWEPYWAEATVERATLVDYPYLLEASAALGSTARCRKY